MSARAQWGVLIGIGALALGFIIFQGIRDTADDGGDGVVTAEAFDLPNLQNEDDPTDRIRLADFNGKPTVVNFFASWCVGCRVEHPELVEFDRRHQDDGVQLVAVMFGDTEDNARDFFNELGGDWPALIQDTGSIAIDYSVTAVPETILVSPSGRVVQKWVGSRGVTADGIDAVIDQFENPPVAQQDPN